MKEGLRWTSFAISESCPILIWFVIRFHSRYDKSHIDVNPSVGEALITYAKVLHEGLTTSEGTRYILVGFNSIDEKDPLVGAPANASEVPILRTQCRPLITRCHLLSDRRKDQLEPLLELAEFLVDASPFQRWIPGRRSKPQRNEPKLRGRFGGQVEIQSVCRRFISRS